MKKNIVILHEDLEWAEQAFNEEFKKRNFNSNLIDIRNATLDNLINLTRSPEEGVILNRVYASVANRNFNNNVKTLELLKELELKGYTIINSQETTLYDYSKFDSAKKMLKEGVATPDLILLKDNSQDTLREINKFLEGTYFPLILKRNMGGRGKDLFKLDDINDLHSKLSYVFSDEYRQSYDAGFVLQNFVVPNREYDCRIAIIDDKFAFSYGRTLISRKEGEIPWLASVSNGSKMISYNPSQEEIALARAATKSIGALFNEVDMTFTKNGPVIIENNPTPNYDSDELDRVESAVDLMIKKF